MTILPTVVSRTGPAREVRMSEEIRGDAPSPAQEHLNSAQPLTPIEEAALLVIRDADATSTVSEAYDASEDALVRKGLIERLSDALRQSRANGRSNLRDEVAFLDPLVSKLESRLVTEGSATGVTCRLTPEDIAALRRLLTASAAGQGLENTVGDGSTHKTTESTPIGEAQT